MKEGKKIKKNKNSAVSKKKKMKNLCHMEFCDNLCLKPGLKVGYPFYLCFSINLIYSVNDWLH